MEKLSAFEMTSSGKSLVEDIAKADKFIRVVAWGMKTVANKMGDAIAVLTVADADGLLYSTRSAGLVKQWEAMTQDPAFDAKPYADFKIAQSTPFDVTNDQGRTEKGKTWHWLYIRPIFVPPPAVEGTKMLESGYQDTDTVAILNRDYGKAVSDGYRIPEDEA